MGLSTAERDAALARVRSHPYDHLVLAPSAYTKDGRVLTEVDGLRVSLHRWLYEREAGPLKPYEFLLLECGTAGCMTPAHRLKSKSTRRPRHKEPRPASTGLPGWKLNSLKTHCPQGHEYTESNTYFWEDREGRMHRKCRKCTIVRAQRQHERERAEKRRIDGQQENRRAAAGGGNARTRR
jgi:hypothetical protein